MEFVYKVCFAYSIVSLMNICSNRGCTPHDLIYKNTSAFASVNLVTDSDYV